MLSILPLLSLLILSVAVTAAEPRFLQHELRLSLDEEQDNNEQPPTPDCDTEKTAYQSCLADLSDFKSQACVTCANKAVKPGESVQDFCTHMQNCAGVCGSCVPTIEDFVFCAMVPGGKGMTCP